MPEVAASEAPEPDGQLENNPDVEVPSDTDRQEPLDTDVNPQEEQFAEAGEPVAAEDDAEDMGSEPVTMTGNERETLLNIVLAMAVGRYGHEPGELRDATLADIVRDHERAGLPCDEDTLRKWLQEASGRDS